MRIDADRFPLAWPADWPRTTRRENTARYSLSFDASRERLVRHLKMLGATEFVLSTNVPLRKDGFPRTTTEPHDPGVAVYWVEAYSQPANGKPATRAYRSKVIACDHWSRVRDNLRACGMAIEALRALQRSGATQVIDRVFTGFAALPATASKSSWRTVLEIGPEITRISPELLKDAYFTASLVAHPDRGGSHDDQARVNQAYADARRELGL